MPNFIGRQSCAIAALLAAGLLICGCGKSGSSGGGSGSAGSDTPEAAFQKWQDAGKAKDYALFYNSMTENGQSELALGIGFLVVAAKRESDQGQKDECQAILAKHNFDEARKLVEGRGGDLEKKMAAFGAAIKDKRGFVIEAMAWLDKNAGENSIWRKLGPELMGEGTLGNLKISGDKATGIVTALKGGRTHSITFQKVSGSWLVDRG